MPYKNPQRPIGILKDHGNTPWPIGIVNGLEESWIAFTNPQGPIGILNGL